MSEISISWASFDIGKSVGSLMKMQEIIVENMNSQVTNDLLMDLIRRATLVRNDVNNIIETLSQLTGND